MRTNPSLSLFGCLLTASVTLFAQTASAGTISTCPRNAVSVTFDDGSVYEICPATNFKGTTFKSIPQVLSTYDCLYQCNLSPSCRRSAYRGSDRTCLLQANTTTWQTDNNYDSVHLVRKIPQTPALNSGLGQWTSVMITPVIPVGAYIVPAWPRPKRVLMFSAWAQNDFSVDDPVGLTQFADFDYTTGAVSQRTVANTQHDMFCPGMSFLPDGRLVITGGTSFPVTSFYDPAQDSFVRGPDMQIGRGYQSSAVTSRGQVFVLGGSWNGGIGGKDGELYDPASNTWTLLPNVPVGPAVTTYDNGGDYRTDNHMWLLGWKQGSVFQGGPSKNQNWISTDGQGRIASAGVRNPDADAMCAAWAMYDAVAGKILSAGGSQSYTDSDGFADAFITTIGDPFTPVKNERTGSLNRARGLINAVALPDGTVLVTGGQKRSIIFTDIDSYFTPELWNPATGTFKELAPAAIPRNYHAVALLLPDARILVGGSGLCGLDFNSTDAQCNRNIDHPDVEIFSPPYLFAKDNSAAVRPVIKTITTSTDSSGRTARVGGSITVTMDTAAKHQFSLMRMGSVTHTVNTDQRRVPLNSVAQTSTKFVMQLPKDAGILLPGFYYLFAMNPAGVPSLAMTVKVNV